MLAHTATDTGWGKWRPSKHKHKALGKSILGCCQPQGQTISFNHQAPPFSSSKHFALRSRPPPVNRKCAGFRLLVGAPELSICGSRALRAGPRRRISLGTWILSRFQVFSHLFGPFSAVGDPPPGGGWQVSSGPQSGGVAGALDLPKEGGVRARRHRSPPRRPGTCPSVAAPAGVACWL